MKKIFLHYIKLTNLLLFPPIFPKSGPAYRRLAVKQLLQNPQGQSVAKPGTPLLNILVENLNMT